MKFKENKHLEDVFQKLNSEKKADMKETIKKAIAVSTINNDKNTETEKEAAVTGTTNTETKAVIDIDKNIEAAAKQTTSKKKSKKNNKSANKAEVKKQETKKEQDKKKSANVKNNLRADIDYYKQNDKMTAPFENFYDKVKDCVEVMSLVKDAYNHIVTEIGNAEKERNDLLHEAEIIYENVYNGWLRHKQMQQVLQRRRAYKELEEDLRPIAAFVKEHSDAFAKLQSASKSIGKHIAERSSENRTYMPRIRTDLKVSETFNNADEEQKEYIRKCVEKRRANNARVKKKAVV
jgi:hypothetical protein